MTSTLLQRYQEVVVPALVAKFTYANALAVPKIVKVVLNVGTSQGLKDPKYLDTITDTLQRITGQKPLPREARKSIAGFKIREGQIVGMKVTLRGARMYDFVEKMVSVALPRVRDFRGLPASLVDLHGNVSIGIAEHMVFPEIRPDEIERIHGLEVTVVTSAKTKEEGLALLTLLGFPFQDPLV